MGKLDCKSRDLNTVLIAMILPFQSYVGGDEGGGCLLAEQQRGIKSEQTKFSSPNE